VSTKQVLLSLAAVFALAGFAAGLVDRHSRVQGLLEYVIGAAVVAGIYVWCRADMLRQSPPRSGRWALWSALLPTFVLPIYLLRTRPPFEAIKTMFKAIAAYLGLALLFGVAAVAASLFSGA
jgi:hypothetical protein